MWALTNIKNGYIYFVSPQKVEHIVSRSIGDLILSTDMSISRPHATIQLKNNQLHIIDPGSKYGTFLNDDILKKQNKIKHNTIIKLKEGDRILFGRLESEYIVNKINLTTILSTLSEELTLEVKNSMKSIKGTVASEFTNNCTHLTMPALSITMKVLLALVTGIPIVTPAYWKEFQKCILNKTAIIDYRNFIPPINESFLRVNELNFDINLNRKKIFEGKKFIFLLAKHMSRYEQVITMGAGECCHLGNKIHKSVLTASNSIVVQYIAGNSQTQSQQSVFDCEKVYGILKQKQKRPIPEREIGLAIIHCSMTTYCNPDVNVISTEDTTKITLKIQSSKLLAKDTPIEIQNKRQTLANCSIPESEILAMTKEFDKNKTNQNQSIVVEDNDSDIELIDTEPFISHHHKESLFKRKNEEIVPLEQPPAKKINTEVDIPVNNVEENERMESNANISKHDFEPLESFLNKSKTPKPSFLTATKPNKSTELATSKRPYSSFNRSKDESDDLFAFKKPDKKKSKHTDTENLKKNPLIEKDFDFRKKNKKINLTSQTASEQLFSWCEEGQSSQTNKNKAMNGNTNQTKVDSKEFIKRVNIKNHGQWLSHSFQSAMKLKGENDTDVKPNETDLWIESIKDCFEVKNTAIVRSTDECDNFYYNKTLKNDNHYRKPIKNFKTFVKVQNFKKQETIIECVPIVID